MGQSNQMFPTISVIVPVYNAEKSLHVCIDSILAQSYTDFELILVDDGSGDDSLMICKEYAGKDDRICVYHISHGGLSKARNYGLEHMHGTYVSFVDSDDVVGKDYLKLLIEMVQRYQVDIAVVKAKPVLTNAINTKVVAEDKVSVEVLRREDALREALLAKDKFGIAAWAKIYHRKLWNSICFPEGALYEDIVTIPWVFALCEQVAYSSSVQYYYVMNPDSITRRVVTEKDWDIVRNLKILMDYIDEKFPELHDAAVARMIKDHICYLYRLVDSTNYRAMYSKLRKDCQKYWREALKNSYVPLHQKAQIRLLLFSPQLYQIARKVINWIKNKRNCRKWECC